MQEKIVNMIRNSYKGIARSLARGYQLTDASHTRLRVRQGCRLLPFLFLLGAAQERNRIQWTLSTQFDVLDFADDLALLIRLQQEKLGKASSGA